MTIEQVAGGLLLALVVLLILCRPWGPGRPDRFDRWEE